ncbi:hypothetical protein [Stenotrophomonas sp.]|uniref:hypothetical protein n=1 Tax=Stenotrophomonas sp. TaxID=69392 RepID=UPI0028AAD49A|nr:hypothetical protein [Stenotrophomonas sp.]
MPMLALLLLHAVLSSVGSGAPDAGQALPAGLTPASSDDLCLQLRLRQDSMLRWERGAGGNTHALDVVHQVEGHWQLRHRFGVGASAAH